MSDVITHLMKLCQIHKINTSPYNPQANGQNENQHKFLMSIVRLIIEKDPSNFVKAAKIGMFNWNTSQSQEYASVSACELQYAGSPRYPTRWLCRFRCTRNGVRRGVNRCCHSCKVYVHTSSNYLLLLPRRRACPRAEAPHIFRRRSRWAGAHPCSRRSLSSVAHTGNGEFSFDQTVGRGCSVPLSGGGGVGVVGDNDGRGDGGTPGDQ